MGLLIPDATHFSSALSRLSSPHNGGTKVGDGNLDAETGHHSLHGQVRASNIEPYVYSRPAAEGSKKPQKKSKNQRRIWKNHAILKEMKQFKTIISYKSLLLAK